MHHKMLSSIPSLVIGLQNVQHQLNCRPMRPNVGIQGPGNVPLNQSHGLWSWRKITKGHELESMASARYLEAESIFELVI